MNAYAVTLRSDSGYSGPVFRERTVVATDTKTAVSKAVRAARKNFALRGYRVTEVKELPGLVR